MFARRNARRHNGPHQLAARLAPTLSLAIDNNDGNSNANGNTLNSPSPSPSPVSTADPVTTPDPATSALPAPKTSELASILSSISELLPTPATSPSSAAASTASSSSPGASSSASAAHSVASSSSALSVAAPSTTANAPILTTQQPASIAFTPTSSLTASPTSTSHASGGISTGVIIGGVAGGLAGLAALGFLLSWCMRRQQSHDIDDFDAQAFKRQSAMLVDDPVEPPRSYNTRPLTMIEHHNASPALAAQAGYGGQNFYGSYGGYGDAPAPEMVQSMGPPPTQPYGSAPMGYAAYNDSPQQLARQPSNAQYLTRQPSTVAGYTPPAAPPTAPPPPPPSSFDPNAAHYIDLNRSSVSPYQAAQYADISRRLGTTNPNGQAPRDSLALPDDPLPSPFDDPVQPSGDHAPVPHVQGNAAHRPGTVYEEGDAYGGI